jgi:predicted metal-dependent hydrolase
MKLSPPSTTHNFPYGTTTISYELRYARRKTLGIQVRPDTTVRVIAPAGATLPAIEEVLQRKAAWIVRKQAEVATYRSPTPPRRYVSGETYFFLGKQLQLKVEQGRKTSVTPDAQWLRIQTPNSADPPAIAALLETWYRRQAQTVFAEVLAAAAQRVLPLGIVAPATIRIRRMKTRWGSCTSKGAITLNLRLIQVERTLIEYVLVHELCHLAQHNHSPAYYKLLDRALPGWRARKKQLIAAEIP